MNVLVHGWLQITSEILIVQLYKYVIYSADITILIKLLTFHIHVMIF